MQTQLSARIEQAMARLEGKDPAEGKSTLLVVDDEKGPRESLRMILSPQHHVLVAENARSALDILAETEIAAITIDLNMPGMKGDELLRHVRKDHPDTEVIIITGYSSVESAVDGIRQGVFDYLTKPFDVVEVSSTIRRALARQESRRRLVNFLGDIGRVLGSDREPEEALDDLNGDHVLQEQLRDVLRKSHSTKPDDVPTGVDAGLSVEFVEALAETIEAREEHRKGHARRVAYLARLLGSRLGLPQSELDDLRTASLLHDIGRVALAPDDPSDDSEFDASDAGHTLVAARLVEPLGFAERVEQWIRHQREHWNGRGGPDGLEFEAIPLGSRIIAVASAFDTLTHDHPYRRALSHSDAIARLQKEMGGRFDPRLVKEFSSLAAAGLCATAPDDGAAFDPDDDPINAIAAAAAWVEVDR